MEPLDFDYLKDRYDFELDRKDRLTAALGLPVAVLTALGGLGAAMVKSFPLDNRLLCLALGAVLCLDTVAFTVCLWWLCRAYVAQTYVYAPLLSDLEAFKKSMEEYARDANVDVAGVKTEIEAEFRKRLIEASDTNTRNNDQRSKWTHRARVSLLSVIALTFIASIIYFSAHVRSAMSTPDPPKPPTAPAPQANVPAKPSFPPNRVIKEGRDQQVPPPKK